MGTPPDRVGRPAQRRAGPPWTGFGFLALAAVLAVCALLFDDARGAFVAQSAVWLVIGVTVLVVRRRGR